MKRLFFLFLMLQLFVACATGKKIDVVKIGMTKQEVVKQLGTPHSTSAIDELVYLNYAFYSDWMGGTADMDYCFVRLRNGKVDATGHYQPSMTP